MRFVIPFKIISDGVSGVIPVTDIHSDLYRTLSTKTDAFPGNVF